jgi:hypothetical protein
MQAGNVEFPAPGAITIAARSPTMLTANHTISAMVTAPLASELYGFASSAGVNIIDFETASSAMNSNPAMVVLPSSGSFKDLINFGPATTVVTASVTAFFQIYWDNSGTSAYSHTVTSSEAAAASANDVEPNDTIAQAKAAPSLPFVLLNGTLNTLTDIDFVVYDAKASDIGKKFRVQTLPGDPVTDTMVDVLAADGTTSLGGPSDSALHEDFTSTAITVAGKYYIKFTTGSAFDPAHNAYIGVIRLVP